MSDRTDQPYKVTSIRHARNYKPGGVMGGEYTIGIEHASGVTSQFTVPEGPNAASDAHVMAMQQVEQAQQIQALPAGAPTAAPAPSIQAQ